MSADLLHGLSIEDAAAFVGVSARTMRRYVRAHALPRSVALALERRQWVSPESARYLETLAYWRGVEAHKGLIAKVGTARERAAVAWGALPPAS